MTDSYIKLGDIVGDSNAAAYRGFIDVISWEWGDTYISNPTGAPGSSRPVIQDLTISVKQSTTSALMLKALNGGQIFRRLNLRAVMPGARLVEIIAIDSTSARITNYSIRVDGPEAPVERWTILLSNFKLTARKLDRAGNLLSVTTGYDSVTGIVT